MRPRTRERIKTAAAALAVLAYFAFFAGWTWTLGFVVLCALVWYAAYYRPLVRAVKDARRKE